jgi:O-antigen/teichoic acid export membrane protein
MTAASRIRNNSFYLFLLTISNYFVGLLVFPHLSRVLTVETFGLVGFAMMYMLIFQSVVEYGFMISGTADISRNRDDSSVLSRLVTDVMATKVVLIALSLLAFLVSALFVEIVRDNLLFLVVFFCSSATAALVPDFYFRGIESMRTIASRSLASRLLSVVLIVAAVRDDADRLWIPAAFFLGNLIALLWSFASMRRSGFRFSQVSYTSCRASRPQSIRQPAHLY